MKQRSIHGYVAQFRNGSDNRSGFIISDAHATNGDNLMSIGRYQGHGRGRHCSATGRDKVRYFQTLLRCASVHIVPIRVQLAGTVFMPKAETRIRFMIMDWHWYAIKWFRPFCHPAIGISTPSRRTFALAWRLMEFRGWVVDYRDKMDLDGNPAKRQTVCLYQSADHEICSQSFVYG